MHFWLITGDKKWIVYKNVKRKQSWSGRDEPAQSKHIESWYPSKESDALCLVLLEKNSFFFSCYQTTKRLIQMCIATN